MSKNPGEGMSPPGKRIGKERTTMVGIIPILVVLGCAIIASITDVAKFKVYNLLTFPCFAAGLVYACASVGWQGFWLSLFGAALGLTILLIPYLMGGVGAGDVKFVMAVGTWIGPTLLIPAILIGCVSTIIYFLIFIGRVQGWRGVWQSLQLMALRLAAFGKDFACVDSYETVQEIAGRPNAHGRLIPFSAMISIGVVASMIVAFWASL
jgi:prepilin peptidase CpaA